MFTSRRLVIAGVVTGIVLAILAAWLAFGRGESQAQYATAKVTRGSVEKTVEASGTLEPRELVGVGAQVSGRVETLHVAIGDTVRKGDLIAQIDSQTQNNSLDTARAQLANVQAQLAGAEASLIKARLAFQRQQALGSGQATSRADYEAAQAELRSAQASRDAIDAQIRSAQVSVNSAQVQLGFTRITAPMDGVVVAIVTKQGQTVNANQSAPTIVVLAKLDEMTIKAEVSEADVINVRAGMPAHFTILGDPDKRYSATLRLVEPAPESIVNEVNSSTSSSSTSSTSSSAIYYNALFEVPNADGRLRALMTAKVTIDLDRRSNVLTIPATALGTRAADGSYAVRVVDEDDKVSTRRVRIGLNNNVIVEVVSGLKQGESVIVGTASAKSDSKSRMGPPMM